MKIITENKKASHNYKLLEKYEAGISLLGQEVKSIKAGKININSSFIHLKGNELFLINANIPLYQPKNMRTSYNPTRARKLLLKKREINKLTGKLSQRGLTMVPLKVYTNARGIIKIEIALAQNKKKIDKREEIKKKEIDEEIRRTLKAKS